MAMPSFMIPECAVCAKRKKKKKKKKKY